MKVTTKLLTALLGAAAMLLIPAVALAERPADAPPHPAHPSHPQHPAHPAHPATPGPQASLKEKAHAYGVNCREQSRKHVKGEKGTPFSQCVTAMAKAANGERAKVACKALSKEHEKGQKGTPFSRCVHEANQLRKEAATG